MIQRGRHLGFTLGAGHALLVICEGGGEDFDGDGAIEFAVTGTVHLAHPAGANRRGDFVRPEAVAW